MNEHPPRLLQSLTVDDFVRAGSCRKGVGEVRDKYFPNATAVNVDDLLVSLPSRSDAILSAAGRSGYGYGYGYGDGDGDGDGDGYGYGYGDGDGYGYGYGYGDGDGDGYGDGDG